MAPIKPELMKIMLDTPLPESDSEESLLELDTPSDQELFPEEVPKQDDLQADDYDWYEEEEGGEEEEEDEDAARERVIQELIANNQGPVILKGIMFGGLRPIPFDPEIDPPIRLVLTAGIMGIPENNVP